MPRNDDPFDFDIDYGDPKPAANPFSAPPARGGPAPAFGNDPFGDPFGPPPAAPGRGGPPPAGGDPFGGDPFGPAPGAPQAGAAVDPFADPFGDPFASPPGPAPQAAPPMMGAAPADPFGGDPFGDFGAPAAAPPAPQARGGAAAPPRAPTPLPKPTGGTAKIGGAPGGGDFLDDLFGDDILGDAAGAPPAPPPPPAPPKAAPAPPTPPRGAAGTPATKKLKLDAAGPWAAAFRSVDLGIEPGTTDDAGRVAALRRHGLGALGKDALLALIAQAR